MPLPLVAAVGGDPYPPFPADPLGRLRWAAKVPLGNATPAKCVLILLALHADSVGKAWPGMALLAELSSASTRGVRMAVRLLEDRGWLETLPREGASSIYYPKSPSEMVCVRCARRWVERVAICPNCGIQGDLPLVVAK